jgi:peptide/nickel transport system substrate-binding protein
MEKAVGFDVQLIADRVRLPPAERGRTPGRSTPFAVGWSGRVDPDGTSTGFVATAGTLNDSGYSNPKLDYIPATARASR